MPRRLLLLVLLTSCGGNPQPAANTTTAATPPPAAEVATIPAHIVFDLPALRHKSIDQIRTKLGKPGDLEMEPSVLQRKAGAREWENNYTKGGTNLLITYNVRTRKVKDFFLSSDKGDVPSLGPLMATAHLSSDAAGFSATPVFVHLDPSTHQYTGVVLKSH